MNLTPHINQLLFSEECVIIPGLGGFVASHSPARVDRISKTIHPPSKRIAFNESLRNNDGILASRISRVYSLAYADAIETVKTEVDSIKTEIKENGSFTLEGIGRLWMDKEEKLKFFYQPETNFLTNAFGLPEISIPNKIVTPKAPLETQAKKEKLRPSIKSKRKQKASRRWFTAASFILMTGFFWMLQTQPVKDAQFSFINPFSNSAEENSIESEGELIENLSESAGLEFDNKAEAVKTIIAPTVVKESIKATSAKAKIVANPAKDFNYFIITGSFTTVENAVNFKNNLIKKGYDADICPVRKGIHYRIMVGGSADKGEAQVILAQVKKDLNPNAWIYTKK
ncbi:MAG: nucleoid DNA-binding protein [Sphingobacteriales bacterium]|jgi:nucleoid DNA-binding protein